MERTRTPVGTPGWLWVILAVAAMGLSLGHTVADLGIIFGSWLVMAGNIMIMVALVTAILQC